MLQVVLAQWTVVEDGQRRAASAGTVADVVDGHDGYRSREGKWVCLGGSPRRGGRVKERREQGEVAIDGERGRSVRARRRVRARDGMPERHGRGPV